MKRLRFLPALSLILSACSENIIVQSPQYSDKMGSVSIALSTDMRSEIVVTKAADEPDVDEFTVELYRTDNNKTRVYNDSYANTRDKLIKLNAGEYRLVAQYGDTLGCGFDKPYYLADATFMVNGPGETLSAEAKLGNVKVAVNYDATISEVYSDYYTVVKHKNHSGKTLTFQKDEIRCGYIPGGEIILQVWAEGKSYTTPAYTYKPNDFVTFTIAGIDANGTLKVSITLDDSVTEKTEEVEIPEFALPQDAPSITISGFDAAGSVHELVEGVDDGHNTKASFVARGSLRNCNLKVESDYLAAKGIPATLDFANLTAEQESLLKSAGFVWTGNMKGSRTFANIDFAGVIADMASNFRSSADDAVVAKFTLEVVDEVGKADQISFSIKSLGITTSLAIEDYNVWATKIYSPIVTINRGEMSLLKLQTSTDNVNWTDVTVAPEQNGNVYTYSTVPVEPDTRYYVRAIYNNNPACASSVITVTTEEAAQLPNSGFENWTNQTFSDGGRGSITWYQPWGGQTNAFWAVNSPLAFNVTSTNPGTFGAEQYHRISPLVAYSIDNHTSGGSRSAHVFNVQLGNYVTNTTIATGSKTYVGEIFTGTASYTDGTHTKDGQTFASRPSKIEFWYKYVPWDTETFYIKVDILAADGTILFTKEITDGPSASSWTKYSIPVEYTVRNKKAAGIYLSFKSASSTTNINKEKDLEIGGTSVNAYFGSSLRIDDIEFIYE